MFHFRGSRNSQAVSLCFDDGPDRGEESLIKALNESGMKATFFWIWEKAERMAKEDREALNKILRLLKKGGHEVGIHSLKHNIPESRAERIFRVFTGLITKEELVEAFDNFSQLLGYEPRHYRPHGVQVPSFRLIKSINDLGLDVILGLHAVGPKESASRYAEVLEMVKPGSIICGHDSIDDNIDSEIPAKIALEVPEIGRIQSRRELRIVTFSELLAL